MGGTDVLLDQLSPGMRGRIAAIDGERDPVMAERLRELGFAEEEEVAVLHDAPFGGDPIAVQVGAMRVALRRADARLVKIETL